MAAAIPPATSSSPAASTGSKLESPSKPTMPPLPSAATSSPAKSGGTAASETGPAPSPEASKTEDQPAQIPAARKRRSRDAQPKKKKKIKEKAKCLKFYVDALDKKMLWAEARIIQCNLNTQKIKVHFVGWSKNYDLWTDPMSITAHGRYAPPTMKGPKVESWDGDMHLFEDMLGTIEEGSFTRVPTPAEPESLVKPEKKRSHKKKTPPKESETSRPPEKAPSEKPKPTRSSAKSKAKVIDAPCVEKVGSKRSADAVKLKTANGRKDDRRDKKRQKQEVKQQAPAGKTALKKLRSAKKKRLLTPEELPLYRELELEDGTMVDFSEQRDKARVERESMQSFLNKCAQIWKKQLGTCVSVQ